MTWTLFWQVFILTNLAGFWVAVAASARRADQKRRENGLLLRKDRL